MLEYCTLAKSFLVCLFIYFVPGAPASAIGHTLKERLHPLMAVPAALVRSGLSSFIRHSHVLWHPGEGTRLSSHTGKGGSGVGGIHSKTHSDYAMLHRKWGGGGVSVRPVVCGGADQPTPVWNFASGVPVM